MSQLHQAMQEGDLQAVKAILNNNPSLVQQPDERGFTPLVLATYHNQQSITKLLLDHGAQVDAQDANGNTALMGIAFKGFTDLANLFIDEYNADLNVRNNSGATALSFAAMFGQEEMARLLLAKGADASIADQNGYTPAKYAAMKGFPALAALLEKHD